MPDIMAALKIVELGKYIELGSSTENWIKHLNTLE